MERFREGAVERLSIPRFLESEAMFSFFAKGSNDYCLRNFPLHREKEKNKLNLAGAMTCVTRSAAAQ